MFGGRDVHVHHLVLAARAVHVGSVSHDFSVHFLVLGVLDEFLVLAGAALADAAERKDEDGQGDDATYYADDDVFCG